MNYHKLVRDRIPEIITAGGSIPDWETLGDASYLQLLEEKLEEELAEYLESKNIIELADLMEVIYAVVESKGYSIEQLEQERLEKAEKRGAFKKKILLKRVT